MRSGGEAISTEPTPRLILKLLLESQQTGQLLMEVSLVIEDFGNFLHPSEMRLLTPLIPATFQLSELVVHLFHLILQSMYHLVLVVQQLLHITEILWVG